MGGNGKYMCSGTVYLQTNCPVDGCDWTSSAKPADARRARYLKNLHMKVKHPELNYTPETSLLPDTHSVRNAFEKVNNDSINRGRMNESSELTEYNRFLANLRAASMLSESTYNSGSNSSIVKKRKDQKKLD